MSEYVASLAEQYFSTLNPIAARLHSDITDTKNAYEKLWDQLSPEEQSQIIDESIIKPEVTLKYGIKTAPESKKGQNYGQKIIHDENFVYRDEFSAPFSYKTQSQMDLRVFSESPVVLPGSPLLKSSQLVQVKLHPKKEKEICVEPAQIIIDDPGKYDETDLRKYILCKLKHKLPELFKISCGIHES